MILTFFYTGTSIPSVMSAERHRCKAVLQPCLEFTSSLYGPGLSHWYQCAVTGEFKCTSSSTSFKVKWNSANVAGAFPTLKVIILIRMWIDKWCCEHCSAMNCTSRHSGSCFGFFDGSTCQGNRTHLFKCYWFEWLYFLFCNCTMDNLRNTFQRFKLQTTNIHWFFTFTFGLDGKQVSV